MLQAYFRSSSFKATRTEQRCPSSRHQTRCCRRRMRNWSCSGGRISESAPDQPPLALNLVLNDGFANYRARQNPRIFSSVSPSTDKGFRLVGRPGSVGHLAMNRQAGLAMKDRKPQRPSSRAVGLKLAHRAWLVGEQRLSAAIWHIVESY